MCMPADVSSIDQDILVTSSKIIDSIGSQGHSSPQLLCLLDMSQEAFDTRVLQHVLLLLHWQ